MGTESSRSAEALAATIGLLQECLTSLPTAMVLREAHHVLFANQEAVRVLGYSQREWDQMDVLDIVDPRFVDEMGPRLARRSELRSLSAAAETRVRRRDGETVALEVRSGVLSAPALDREVFLHAFVDVSEMRKNEERLRDLSASLEAIIDNIPLMVFVKDAKTLAFVRFNRAGEELLGWPREALLGKSDHDFWPAAQADFFVARDRETLAKGTLVEIEEELIQTRDKGVRVLRTKKVPILGDDGAPRYLLGISEDVTDRKRSESSLYRLANLDALTGLPNRGLLRDRLDQALTRVRWNGRLVGVLVVDLDRFKSINDSLGHAVGDRLLVEAGARLCGAVRDGDTVARLGGDDFAVVLTDVAHKEDVGLVTEKIAAALREPFCIDGTELFVTPSVGISVAPTDGADVDTLLRHAEAAMYQAKEHGRNNHQFFSPALDATVRRRFALEHPLRRALAEEQFQVHYQPVVDLGSGAVVGMEALVRWRHPELGMVSPAEFIPLAEETGLIVDLGEWVLRTACRQTARWIALGHASMHIAVNLSARQCRERSLAEAVGRTLRETGLPPSALMLELTETSLMNNPGAGREMLERLVAQGVSIALDDFGTGYSCLGYLKSFPIAVLKVDQSFVRNITSDQRDRMIASTVVGLAHGLDLTVVAEAVETEGQLEVLRTLGCDRFQGYLFSRPVPADEATTLLAAQAEGRG